MLSLKQLFFFFNNLVFSFQTKTKINGKFFFSEERLDFIYDQIIIIKRMGANNVDSNKYTTRGITFAMNKTPSKIQNQN